MCEINEIGNSNMHNVRRDFIVKGRLGGEQKGKGTQDCSAMWLTALGFMVMGFVSGLSGQSF